MSRPSPYRRFHRIQRIDLFATAAVFAVGWLVWPSMPSSAPRSHRSRMTVSYGEMDPQSIGFLQYPGHFAFSTPLGFGSISELYASGDPQWTVSGVFPFVEPLPPIHLPSETSAWTNALPAPSLASIPRPVPSLRMRPAEQRAHPRMPRSTSEIEMSEALERRDFHATLLERRLAESAGSSGELQAHLQVNPKGRVSHVVFLPSPFAWDVLRPLEDALLRGVANPESTDTSGWVWIRWQKAEAFLPNPIPAT